MAVIKCSNCENEILDTEITCPYCDFPLRENKKKTTEAENGFSALTSDSTMKIPAIKDEPKLATSSDFKKEKAAILKDIKMAEEDNSDFEKTVKISRDDILNGKLKSEVKGATATKEEIDTSDYIEKEYDEKKHSGEKGYTKYIVIGITLLGILLICWLAPGISDSIKGDLNSRKKTNKTVEVKSSAEEIAKAQGYKFSSSTLTIIDEKVMIDYESADETPWYEYRDSIKHVTIKGEIKKIGAHTFDGFKNITDVTLSETVETIGDSAFYNCTSLKKVLLPDDNMLMEIGKSAFELCENLERISGYTKKAKFDPILITIDDRAFAHCSSLKEFKLPDDIELGEDVFVGCDKEFSLVCTKESNAYNYALENDIDVKEDFSINIIEEEYMELEEETEESDTNSEESTTDEDTQTPPADTNTGNDTQTPGNDAPVAEQPSEIAPIVPETTPEKTHDKEALDDLSNKLTGATTPEEEQKILEEMDKYY